MNVLNVLFARKFRSDPIMYDASNNRLPYPQISRIAEFPTPLPDRAQAFRDLEIHFISSSEFTAEAEVAYVEAETAIGKSPNAPSAPSALPVHLRRICDAELLDREAEAALFRQMNYLKFCADARRTAIPCDDPDAGELFAIEEWLERARSIRDHLVKANMRLVISIVKKYVTPQQSFDEMLSNGTMILLNAVEKFDFDRGFRFSTYAYRSIARDSYRTLMEYRQEDARFIRDAEEWAFGEAEGRASSRSDQVWSSLRELTATLIDKLDRREKFIIRSRYALGSHRKVKTFQYLADKLGVSKERVRQLEQRAVAKLQASAAQHNLDEMFGAALV